MCFHRTGAVANQNFQNCAIRPGGDYFVGALAILLAPVEKNVDLGPVFLLSTRPARCFLSWSTQLLSISHFSCAGPGHAL